MPFSFSENESISPQPPAILLTENTENVHIWNILWLFSFWLVSSDFLLSSNVKATKVWYILQDSARREARASDGTSLPFQPLPVPTLIKSCLIRHISAALEIISFVFSVFVPSGEAAVPHTRAFRCGTLLLQPCLWGRTAFQGNTDGLALGGGRRGPYLFRYDFVPCLRNVSSFLYNFLVRFNIICCTVLCV